mgnify:FL=1
MPAGPSMRTTGLDRAQLIETISCGRPGTAMPFNLDTAYKTSACYGLPVGTVPPETRQGANLKTAEVAALADFLIKEVKGQTTLTRAGCAAFFGGNLNFPLCTQYK